MPRFYSALTILLFGISAFAQETKPFPEPDKVLQDVKQFDAVTLGADRTLTIRQAPKDFQLDAFSFADGDKTLYMQWASGRLEHREIKTGKSLSQSHPFAKPIFEVAEDPANKQLVLVTEQRHIRFVDPKTRRITREITAAGGRFNYDIQKVLLAPDGSWLAYVTQDNGQVLDIRGEKTKTLADLEDAYDIALSPDGQTLWALNRSKLFGFRTADWQTTGTTPLLDQVKLDMTPMLALLDGNRGPVAFIPSQSGLLRYELNSLKGAKITNIPTYWVAADQRHQRLFVHEFKTSSMYDAQGSRECHWAIRPAQNYKLSPTGAWLGSRMFGKVELWSTSRLYDACASLANN